MLSRSSASLLFSSHGATASNKVKSNDKKKQTTHIKRKSKTKTKRDEQNLREDEYYSSDTNPTGNFASFIPEKIIHYDGIFHVWKKLFLLAIAEKCIRKKVSYLMNISLSQKWNVHSRWNHEFKKGSNKQESAMQMRLNTIHSHRSFKRHALHLLPRHIELAVTNKIKYLCNGAS